MKIKEKSKDYDNAYARTVQTNMKNWKESDELN